jgi:hypothetical protein
LEDGVLTVGYLEVEAIVRLLSGVDDAKLVLRRFKYLQRMSFPAGSNTGRGRKASFDLDQLLQILVAFELIQTGCPPTRAVRTVRTNWPELLPAMALGWVCARRPDLASLRELLVMDAAALHDAGGSEDPNEKVASPFKPVPAVDLLGWSPDGWQISRVIVDPCSLAAGLTVAAEGPMAGLSREDLDASYLELWTSTRSGSPEDWAAGKVPIWEARA